MKWVLQTDDLPVKGHGSLLFLNDLLFQMLWSLLKPELIVHVLVFLCSSLLNHLG